MTAVGDLKCIRVKFEEVSLERARRVQKILEDRGYFCPLDQAILLHQRVSWHHDLLTDKQVFQEVDTRFDVLGPLIPVVMCLCGRRYSQSACGGRPGHGKVEAETSKPKQLDADIMEAQGQPCPTCRTPYGGWRECGF